MGTLNVKPTFLPARSYSKLGPARGRLAKALRRAKAARQAQDAGMTKTLKTTASKPAPMTLSVTNEHGVTTSSRTIKTRPESIAPRRRLTPALLEEFQHIIPFFQTPEPAFGMDKKKGQRSVARNGRGRRGQKPHVRGRWTQAGFIPIWGQHALTKIAEKAMSTDC